MTGSMVERIARAICKSNNYEPDHVGERIEGYGRWHRPAWTFYKADAITALTALREYTPVVRDQGHVVHELRGAPADIWRVLIDAALQEEV